MRAVIDTSVLIWAIVSSDGTAREAVRRSLTDQARPLIGNSSLLEYETVQGREGLFGAPWISSRLRHDPVDAFLSSCEPVGIFRGQS